MYRTRMVLPLLLALSVGACNRLYSISVNDQVLYDPRPGNPAIRFEDAGLQSCVNVRMQEDDSPAPEDITILSCGGLEIESLEGISALESLESIDLSNNELEHLDELGRLPRLLSVRANGNPLQDVSGLLRARSLTTAALLQTSAIPCSQLNTLQQRLGYNLLRPAQCR